MSDDQVKRLSPFDVVLIAAVAVFAFTFAYTMFRTPTPMPSPSSVPGVLLEVGKPLPKISAAGWVNGTVPAAQDLEGKVIVVDAWATYCLPCRIKAPSMVKTYEKYKDQDVVFIGLTIEGEGLLPQIQEFLDETGVSWVNGWGAYETLAELRAEFIPSVWVAGPDGTIVWNSESPGKLEDGIEQALAMK